jgi:hypothetical protein
MRAVSLAEVSISIISTFSHSVIQWEKISGASNFLIDHHWVGKADEAFPPDKGRALEISGCHRKPQPR